MGEPIRLQRYLASAGVAARRKAETLITEGRVKVNGKVVTQLGSKVDPDNDEVMVDGVAVMALDAFYVLLNKPKGCITAVTDDRGRPTVMDYLPNVPVPVKPVGRLDFYTEGVLLLTNDGELAAKLLAPGSHVPKTYHVKVHGQLDKDHVKALREGIVLDDGQTTMPAEVAILPGESKYTWLAITIHEGKHRQIHRMIEALGFAVDKLQRVAFATLTFEGLRIGDARELNQQELNGLRDTVGLDHSKVARGRWRSDREKTDIPRRARAKARDEAEAEAAENELRRQANIARRAANAEAGVEGDAWDGEGDEGGDDEVIHHTGLGMEDRDAAGGGEPMIHHTGLGMEDRDEAGRTGGAPPAGRGGPRGGGGDRSGGGRGAPRGRDDRSGGRGASRGGPRRSDIDEGAGIGSGQRGRAADRPSGGPGVRGGRAPSPRGGPRGGDRPTGRAYAARGDSAPPSVERPDRNYAPRGDRPAPSAERPDRNYAPRGERPDDTGGPPRRPYAQSGGGDDRPARSGPGGRPMRDYASRGGGRDERPARSGPGGRPTRDYASRGGGRDERPARSGPGGRPTRDYAARGSGGGGRDERPARSGPGDTGGRPTRPYASRGADDTGGPPKRPYAPRGGDDRGARGDRPARPSAARGAPSGEGTERDKAKGRWPRPAGGRAGGSSGADRPPRGMGPRGSSRSYAPPATARSEGSRGGEAPRGGVRGEGPRGGYGPRAGGRSDGPRSDGPRGGQGRSSGSKRPAGGRPPPKRGR